MSEGEVVIEELENIKDRHRKRYGSPVARVGTDEDVAWLLAEVERLNQVCSLAVGVVGALENDRPDLKRVLMELGNRLVTEHGWEPASGSLWERIPSGDHTGLIAGLTEQINDSPEMRELLGALGFDWPIVETQTEKGGEA